jgi:hypothetical protein
MVVVVTTTTTTNLMMCCSLMMMMMMMMATAAAAAPPIDTNAAEIFAQHHQHARRRAHFGKPAAAAPLPLSLNQLSNHMFYPEKDQRVLFYLASAQSISTCPSRDIQYTDARPSAYIPGAYYIPHTKIIASGRRCGTGKQGEYMMMIPGQWLASPVGADIANATAAYKALTLSPQIYNVFMYLLSMDQQSLYVGVELTRNRVCGGKIHWSKGSVFLYLKADKTNIDFRQYGYIRDGEDAMLAFNNKSASGSSPPCLYKNSLIPGPSTSPLPTPTPVPGAVPSSSPNAFDRPGVIRESPPAVTTTLPPTLSEKKMSTTSQATRPASTNPMRTTPATMTMSTSGRPSSSTKKAMTTGTGTPVNSATSKRILTSVGTTKSIENPAPTTQQATKVSSKTTSRPPPPPPPSRNTTEATPK